MTSNPTRRQFLKSAAAGLAGGSFVAPAGAADASAGFSFILLGDLHFDRLEHHDLAWVETDKPGDVAQIRNYSQLTAEVMPHLFRAVRAQVDALRTTAAPPAFVLQVGDLVEGLCGNEELAVRQNREAIEFVAGHELGLPFLFTKGNHDVTGPGADVAFDEVLRPYQREQAALIDGNSAPTNANLTLAHRGVQFVCFDAYDKSSLEWLEGVVEKRTAERLFVVIHPPVVPYGARATWHLYSSARDSARREKLLDLLGRHEALVLGGHLHKFSAISRTTRTGRFAQLAVSSVLAAVQEQPRDPLHGVEAYTPDQVDLEPQHAPETREQRRAIYSAERPLVKSFEYANSAGYAIVSVTQTQIKARVYSGADSQLLQSVSLLG